MGKRNLAIVLALCLSMSLMSSAMVNAAAGTKTAKKSNNYYSWCGILCFTMGVEGNYHSNGKKIDKFSKTKAVTSTHGTSYNLSIISSLDEIIDGTAFTPKIL